MCVAAIGSVKCHLVEHTVYYKTEFYLMVMNSIPVIQQVAVAHMKYGQITYVIDDRTVRLKMAINQ